MPRIDPDIEAIIPLLPREDLTDPMADRRNAAERVASRQAIDTGDMRIEDRTVPSSPDVAVRIYRPRDFHGAVIWLHGGGFVMGDLDSEHPWAARIAQLSGAAVISVDYRLAPEHRFPAQLHDAYAVLTWTGEHASELGIDPDRIAIGGHRSSCISSPAHFTARR
jgi:acetyl esterase/lipase